MKTRPLHLGASLIGRSSNPGSEWKIDPVWAMDIGSLV